MLENQLLSNPSATEVLEQYCYQHFGESARIVRAEVLKRSQRVKGNRTIEKDLALQAGESLSYRKVRLHCGEIALSDAENWYVPERLTDSMNQALAESETPFGKVVKPLGFKRETLGSRWNAKNAQSHPNTWMFENTAHLIDAQNRPFSFLKERYLRSLLGR